MEIKTLEQLKQQRFQTVRRKAVNLPEGELVQTSLFPGKTLPLVIEPAINDLDLSGWARGNRELIESKLLQHGALLFRNFNLSSPSDFREFATVIYSKLAVFTSNIHPAPKNQAVTHRTGSVYPTNKKIRWHNEDSFDNFQWPSKIMFYCAKSPQQGGETPITDCRRLYELIPQETKAKFLEKGVMFVKNYYPELGMNWQDDFATQDKSQVEKHCREASIDFSWNDEGRLRLRYVRPAAVRHPVSGEVTWFNQAQLVHLIFQEPEIRELWKRSFAEEDLPSNCYYGDGSPIEDSEMLDIVRAYDQIETAFPWQAGDALLLDNMLAAHARNPFVGAREIYVALDSSMDYRDLKLSAGLCTKSL